MWLKLKPKQDSDLSVYIEDMESILWTMIKMTSPEDCKSEISKHYFIKNCVFSITPDGAKYQWHMFDYLIKLDSVQSDKLSIILWRWTKEPKSRPHLRRRKDS